MTTLTVTLALFLAVAVTMLVVHRLEERSRRRDREIVRRINTYMAQLPPRRPW